MNKMLQILLKILKWAVVTILGFYFLGITIFGFKKVDKSGSWDFYWSGIEALWESDEEFGFWRNKEMYTDFNGVDGPYIVKDSVFYVDSDNKLNLKKFNKQDSLLVKVSNGSKDSFYLQINESYKVETETHQLPQKLIAISDIEGNFNGFSSFLKNNKVIDNNYNWIYGKGHLVLVGDFVDRGSNVTQVLWLIYKLEQQAKISNGKVHFILGNHEIMNFQGKWSYNNRKYPKVAQEVSGLKAWDKATQFLYSKNTELGKWLKTKNVIEKVGDYLFVHAGLSPEILEFELSLAEINKITSENWDYDLYNNPTDDSIANFLIGRKGPIWYRGLAIDYKDYDKINEAELKRIFTYYESNKIVIGHTVVNDISTDFDGRVIKIDLKHGKTKNSGKTKGLLIEKGVEYKVDDLGNKEKI
ncbi:MAG: metallophosphoesterase [Bacteroidetes bacterium]|nr:metallophosphoesterase [Bacteroidota bacterium]